MPKTTKKKVISRPINLASPVLLQVSLLEGDQSRHLQFSARLQGKSEYEVLFDLGHGQILPFKLGIGKIVTRKTG